MTWRKARNSVLAVLAVTFFGCGDNNWTFRIDSRAQDLVDEFLEKSKNPAKKIHIEFVDLPDDGAGVKLLGKCIGRESSESFIYIDEPNWKESSNLTRRFIVFHELGHCILDRLHVDGVSYMLKSVPDSDWIEGHKEELDSEMFLK